MKLVIVADDLTGANDTAVQFVSAGARAVTLLEPALAGVNGGRYDVVALSSETRGSDPKTAYQGVKRLAEAIRRRGGVRVYKKIDSSLRGHLGVEIDALLDGVGLETALVAPAYPANRRLTAGGYHLIDGRPAAESDARLDPLTPVTESNLVRLLERQTRRKVGHLALDTIALGPEGVAEELKRLRATGVGVVACDATTDGHLDVLAGTALSLPGILPCGSAGLARALARRVEGWAGLRGTPQADGEGALPEGSGGILGVCGSHAPVAQRQVERAARAEGLSLVRIELPHLLRSDRRAGEVERAAREAAGELMKDRHVLVYLGGGDAGEANLALGQTATILSGLGEVVEEVVRQTKVQGFILTGGDTAMAVCRKLGASTISIEREVLPGVVQGRLVDGRGAVRRIITKSGSFGDPDTLVRLFEQMAARPEGAATSPRPPVP